MQSHSPAGMFRLTFERTGFPASFSLAVVDSSVEEVDYVLAGEASRIHNLVDDAGLPGGACNLVALSSDLDVFCLGFT